VVDAPGSAHAHYVARIPEGKLCDIVGHQHRLAGYHVNRADVRYQSRRVLFQHAHFYAGPANVNAQDSRIAIHKPNSHIFILHN
jgi:hypothetical protein